MARRASMKREVSEETPANDSATKQPEKEKDVLWDEDLALFIFKQCFMSRIIIFCIQFIFNIIVTDFPSDAFKGISIPKHELNVADGWIQFALSGLTKWDGVHFLHIASNGYTFEKSLAFFPFFPTLVYYLTLSWSWLTPFLHFSTTLAITAVSINFIAFMISGQLLYTLLLLLTRSAKVSVLGCLVFCFNPASIFFSAAYSESVFTLLTLSGLILLYFDPTFPFLRHLGAATFFALAFATRANGLLNYGYIMYAVFIETLYDISEKKFIWQQDCVTAILKLFRFLAVILMCWIVFGALVMAHGTRMQHKFCTQNETNLLSADIINYANVNGLVLPGQLDNISWCRNKANIVNPVPVFYPVIQGKYWDVKLFGYWQTKKIPCFILAFPALLIVIYGVSDYVRRLWKTYGSLAGVITMVITDPFCGLPFAVHALVLSLSAVFLYNVEVVTRILFSSSPFVYLALANYMHRRTPLVTVSDLQYPPILPFFTNFSRTHLVHALILFYLLSYFFIGTLLHVNWLPFT